MYYNIGCCTAKRISARIAVITTTAKAKTAATKTTVASTL